MTEALLSAFEDYQRAFVAQIASRRKWAHLHCTEQDEETPACRYGDPAYNWCDNCKKRASLFNEWRGLYENQQRALSRLKRRMLIASPGGLSRAGAPQE